MKNMRRLSSCYVLVTALAVIMSSLSSCFVGKHIKGNTIICAGTTTTLKYSKKNVKSVGNWYCNPTNIATVDISAGTVTGVSAGAALVTYSVGADTFTTIITVKPAAAPITISQDLTPLSVCKGSKCQLYSAVGGIWASNNVTTAAINRSGQVKGIEAGTSTITYTSPMGCTTTSVITVNSIPLIGGVNHICLNGTTNLVSSVSGGIWESAYTDIGTVGSTTGVVTGKKAGATIITYKPTTGCPSTIGLYVYSSPPSIQGNKGPFFVNSSAIQLDDLLKPGAWQSTNQDVATVDPSSGDVYGISAGTTTISYTACEQSITTTITVRENGNLAADSCTFLGAVYSNFTGIPDDNPAGFTSTYLRLSHSLFQPEGICDSANACQRWIAVRNFMFELTYNNNNNNLKMYSLDTFGNKYSNRLDLYTHAYFNGSLYLNLFTFVMPQTAHFLHKRDTSNRDRYKGDGAHFYLDAFTTLALANVIDSGMSHPSTGTLNPTQTYTMKTNLYGLSFKYKTTDGVYNTPFNIELGLQLFWLFTSSNSINPNLNPQYNSIRDFNNAQNSSTHILASTPQVYPYLALNALVQYNTNRGNSSSNIFLHYRYIDNYTYDFSNSHYHNNFFEFQLGYALDLSKLISKPTTTP